MQKGSLELIPNSVKIGPQNVYEEIESGIGKGIYQKFESNSVYCLVGMKRN